MTGQKTRQYQRNRNRAVRFALPVLLAALALSFAATTAASAADNHPGLSAIGETSLTVQGDSPAPTGLAPDETPVPSVHDANESTDGDGLRVQDEGSLPAQYSSVAAGNVTSVKNQDVFGTCWAFTAITCIESSMLAHGQASAADLSERHLAYFTNNPVADPLGNTVGDDVVASGSGFLSGWWETPSYLNAGGNSRWAANILATWQGAVEESVVPTYEDLISSYEGSVKSRDGYAAFLEQTALDDSSAYDLDAVHLTGTYAINMSDRDDVKRAVMDYGAAAVQIQYDDRFYNASNHSHYCNDFKSVNHEVAIVGWDDDYPRANFKKTGSGVGGHHRAQQQQGAEARDDFRHLLQGWFSVKVVYLQADKKRHVRFQVDRRQRSSHLPL